MLAHCGCFWLYGYRSGTANSPGVVTNPHAGRDTSVVPPYSNLRARTVFVKPGTRQVVLGGTEATEVRYRKRPVSSQDAVESH